VQIGWILVGVQRDREREKEREREREKEKDIERKRKRCIHSKEPCIHSNTHLSIYLSFCTACPADIYTLKRA